MAMSTFTTTKEGTGVILKDQLFNRDRVTYLAKQFQAADSDFSASAFIRNAVKPFPSLELKERIVHIACTLEDHLSTEFKTAAKQITQALPPPLDPTLSDDDFGDFIFAPLGEFVVRNGLAKKNVSTSLKTLKQITQRFSMEDAIRAFLDAHPEQTLKELTKWSTDKNYHVRRLVSEGTRPLLPWSRRLEMEIETPIPFLDTLHADPTRYVTRSVCNHLNDIAKSNPKMVVDTLKRWKKLAKQTPKELQWMNRHALRTLVKQGNPNALKFLGYRADPKIEVTDLTLTPNHVRPGEAIEFSFSVSASRDESLMVDYVIDFVKANGKRSPKVHKIKSIELKKNGSTVVRKRHPFRANATTFKLYPGTHHLTLQINGKPYGTLSFELETP